MNPIPRSLRVDAVAPLVERHVGERAAPPPDVHLAAPPPIAHRLASHALTALVGLVVTGRAPAAGTVEIDRGDGHRLPFHRRRRRCARWEGTGPLRRVPSPGPGPTPSYRQLRCPARCSRRPNGAAPCYLLCLMHPAWCLARTGDNENHREHRCAHRGLHRAHHCKWCACGDAAGPRNRWRSCGGHRHRRRQCAGSLDEAYAAAVVARFVADHTACARPGVVALGVGT